MRTSRTHADRQHGVHLGDVNLALFGLAGVADFHPGEQTELNTLPCHTLVACARSDCLARISPDRSAIAPRT